MLRSLWGRRLIGLALAVLVGRPGWIGSWAVGEPTQRAGAGLSTTVDAQVTVLDGDTLRLAGGDRVRLLGVDTPETGRPLAQAATDFARRFIAGQTVRLVPDSGERDHYGRLLADVRVERGSLAEALVNAGLAWVYRSADARLLALQAGAVEDRRGVHAWQAPVGGMLYRPTATSFHHPECRLPGNRRSSLPLEENPGCLFKMGLSPCRRCLPWPPSSATMDGLPGARARGSRRD